MVPFWGVITEIGQIGLWLQTLGVVVVLVIILNVISFFYNRKRIKQIEAIRQDMTRIEGKIDKISELAKS